MWNDTPGKCGARHGANGPITADAGRLLECVDRLLGRDVEVAIRAAEPVAERRQSVLESEDGGSLVARPEGWRWARCWRRSAGGRRGGGWDGGRGRSRGRGGDR